MNYTVQVDMLPTNKPSVLDYDEHGQLWYNPDKMTGAKVELFQHIYFTKYSVINYGDFIITNYPKCKNSLGKP